MGQSYCDGQLRRIDSLSDVRPGTVLRMINSDGSVSPFSDMVVLDVRANEYPGSGQPTAVVKLARPYLYASSTGTTCPSALLGHETFEVSYDRMIQTDSMFRVVTTARGSKFQYDSTPGAERFGV